MKNKIVLIVFLLMGLFLGSVLTEVAQNVSFLEFLTWGKTVGVGSPNPVSINLAIVTLSFGISLQLNIAVLISIIASLMLYKKFA